VDSSADAEVELLRTAQDRPRTRHRTRGAVETAEEAVARGVDLLPAEAREVSPHILVVAGEQVSPCPVAERGCSLRGADEVGQQNRREDGVGDPIGLLTFNECPRLTGDVLERLDEGVRRQRDGSGIEDAASDVDHLISLRRAVEYQGRHADAREHISKVGLAQDAIEVQGRGRALNRWHVTNQSTNSSSALGLARRACCSK
jgi:hypothetical protein